MPSVATFEQIPNPAQVDPRFAGRLVLGQTVEAGASFAEMSPAGLLQIPDFIGGGKDLVVPSLAVITPRNARGVSHEARVVDLYPTHPELAALHAAAERRTPKLSEIERDVLARVISGNVGANGLHHVNQNTFRNQVFYPITTRGAHPYVTQIGQTLNDSQERIPVWAVIGATDGSPKAELALFKAIGATERPRRR